jgi:hypothetical protein
MDAPGGKARADVTSIGRVNAQRVTSPLTSS